MWKQGGIWRKTKWAYLKFFSAGGKGGRRRLASRTLRGCLKRWAAFIFSFVARTRQHLIIKRFTKHINLYKCMESLSSPTNWLSDNKKINRANQPQCPPIDLRWNSEWLAPSQQGPANQHQEAFDRSHHQTKQIQHNVQWLIVNKFLIFLVEQLFNLRASVH